MRRKSCDSQLFRTDKCVPDRTPEPSPAKNRTPPMAVRQTGGASGHQTTALGIPSFSIETFGGLRALTFLQRLPGAFETSHRCFVLAAAVGR
eukprot:jgi/Botrbrau1/15848/Bobra.40_1s0032.1